ncbi:MAG: SdrD B-like domain-containing protein [Panacibacter sp.]
MRSKQSLPKTLPSTKGTNKWPGILKLYAGSFLFLFMLSTSSLFAQSGKVFRDGNGDGAIGVSEPGIGGILVKSYINAGATDQLLGTATTDAFGNFTLSPAAAAGQRVRVEFQVPSGLCNIDPTVDFPTIAGTGSKTTVQFATGPQTNINLGLVAQDFYVTSSNPALYVPKYTNGSGAAGTTSGDNFAAVLGMNYNSTGIPAANGGTGPNPTTVLKVSQVGSVWGTAYSKQSRKLFLASFLKRHTGMGPGGSGEIYMLDPTAPPSAPTSPTFFSLDALGFPTHAAGSYVATPSGFSGVIGSNSDRGLPGTEGTPNRDASAFDQVGKVSLGGMDLSDDGRYLFVTNLYDKKLYRVDLQNPNSPVTPTAAQVTPFNNAPWLQAGFSCANGVARPFAVKYFRGKIYVGVVCTGESGTPANASTRDAGDLRAYVFEMSPLGDGSGAVTSIEFPLNYNKSYAGSNNSSLTGWFRWANNWPAISSVFNNSGSNEFSHPQPILSDLEFDNDGSMIIGFMDRTGHQTGKSNYRPDGTSTTLYSTYIGGDILRTYKDPSTCTFSLEANGVAGAFTSTSNSSINGPGTHNGTGTSFTGYTGNGKEFYWGDYAQISSGSSNDYPNAFHDEGVMGGLALWPSSGQVITTGLDPVLATVWSGGVYKLDNTNGSRLVSSGYNLYNNETGTRGFGKANGLGDIEISGDLLSNLEIGNRVWLDTDGDGIQDGDEDGIQGVTVGLYTSGGTFIVNTTTDASGNYYFNNLNVPGGLGVSTAYIIKVASTQYNVKPLASPLLGLVSALTVTDAVGNGLADLSDNDASLVSGIVQMNASTGVLGESRHNYDIGFIPCFKASAVHTNVTCNGDNNGSIDVTVTGNFIGTLSYAWTDNGTPSLVTTQDRSGLAGGLYAVNINDEVGCSVNISDETTTIEEPAVIVITGTTTDVTTVGGSDGTIDVAVTGGNGGNLYAWVDNGSPSAVITEDRTGLTAGTYKVTVTDSKGCTKEETFIIKPVACTINVSAVLTSVKCHGENNGSIDVTVTDNIGTPTFAWIDNGSPSVVTTEDRSGLAPGTYSVTVTDAVGCSASTSGSPSVITEPAAIVVTGTTTDVTTVGGSDGTIDVTVTGGNGGYTYTWVDNGSPSVVTDQDRSGLPAGTYTVTVTDSKGCSESKTFVIIQPDCNINVSAVVTSVKCHGENNGTIDVTVTGTPNGTPTFAWIDNGSPSVVTTEDRTGLAPGTYSVTVMDAAGCSASTSASPSVITEPAAIVVTGTTTNVTTNGGSNGTIDVTVTGGNGGNTYAWVDNGSPSVVTTEDRTGLPAGTYTVTVTDNKGCSETKTFTITQPDCNIHVSAVVTSVKCHGENNGSIDVTVTGTPNGTPSFAWIDNGSPSVITTEDRSGLAPGTYSVTVMDAAGCSASTSASPSVVTEPAAISVTEVHFNTTGPNKTDGSINVTVTGGTTPYSYHWNTNAITEDLSNIGVGTYTLTVTDAHGCSGNITVVIISNCACKSKITVTNPSCAGSTDGVLKVTTTGGSGQFSYLWNNNATTQTIHVGAGTYSVAVTDRVGGCVSTATATVKNPKPLKITSVVVPVTTTHTCNGKITLSATGGTAPYTFTWSDNYVGAVRTALCMGNYSITVSDAHGCSANCKVKIVCQPPSVQAPAGSNEVQSANISFTAAVSPNPTKGLIRISINADAVRNATVNIFNLTGQIVKTEKIALAKGMNYKEMNLNAFAQGIYQVQIISDNDAKVVKVVLEK